MDTQPKVLIITINWRQPHTTLECVATLQSLTYPNKEILVIDNGSNDNSVSILQKETTNFTLLCNPDNVGFAAGVNIGLDYAKKHHFPYALIINNDAFPAPEMLTQLIKATNPDIALLTPLIFYEHQPQTIWYGGGRQDPQLLELRGRQQGQPIQKTRIESHDVDYVLGACLLINLAIVPTVGLMNEQYFMYYEDLDWSIRCRVAGYRLHLSSNAHLYHRVAKSSGGEDSPVRRYHLARSSVIFFHTHAHRGNRFVILPYRIFSGFRQIGRLLFKKNFKATIAYLRGIRDGLHVIRHST